MEKIAALPSVNISLFVICERKISWTLAVDLAAAVHVVTSWGCYWLCYSLLNKWLQVAWLVFPLRLTHQNQRRWEDNPRSATGLEDTYSISVWWEGWASADHPSTVLSPCNLASITYTRHMPLSNPLIHRITTNPFFAFIEGFTWLCRELLFLACLFTGAKLDLSIKKRESASQFNSSLSNHFHPLPSSAVIARSAWLLLFCMWTTRCPYLM